MNDLPVAVLDQIVRQQAEIDRLNAELEEAEHRVATQSSVIIGCERQLAEARAENDQLVSLEQAHCAGWEQGKQQIIEEWEKPYGLTDGSKFIDRLRNLEYKEPESEASK